MCNVHLQIHTYTPDANSKSRDILIIFIFYNSSSKISLRTNKTYFLFSLLSSSEESLSFDPITISNHALLGSPSFSILTSSSDFTSSVPARTSASTISFCGDRRFRFGASAGGEEVVGEAFLRRRGAPDCAGVDSLSGRGVISAVRDSRKSYCFWVDMICLLLSAWNEESRWDVRRLVRELS